MNIKQKLTNPFALVAQGFGVGAILFFATMSPAADSQPQDNDSAKPVQSASLAPAPKA
jgi:hypothetical protein